MRLMNPINTYPPLTLDNILTLRGQPVTKMIETPYNASKEIEEWTYYNIRTKTKESYVFKSGYLIGYKKEIVV